MLRVTEELNKPISKIAVLGAGVMGAQIAAHFANAGTDVLLLDMPANGRDRSSGVRQSFAKAMKLSPAPLASKRFEQSVSFGNFEDDLSRLSDVDWVLEAVIEDLTIKRALWSKVLTHVKKDTILSTNTSGIPIAEIAADFPEDRKTHFLGTHFFNPPRYLKLFEIIPGEKTQASVLHAVSSFAKDRLGKGVVVAKDTPNFIANRIGTYAMLGHMEALGLGYSVEEIDFLTGPLTGRPKSATFRTADVVGLDTLIHVCRNLYKAIPADEKRERFSVPPLLEKLASSGRLGAKSKFGFYTKKGDQLYSVNPETGEYAEPKPIDLPEAQALRKEPSLAARWQKLFFAEGRTGSFIRRFTVDTLWYSAARIPEIADSPADIDNAMKWGFGWEMGPFEIWDAIGFDAILEEFKTQGNPIPSWVSAMKKAGVTRFYEDHSNVVNTPTGKHFIGKVENEWTVADRKEGRVDVWSNAESGLVDIGDGVLLMEFRSKANTMGGMVVEGLLHAVDILESGKWKALVVGNDGANFTVGANLGELAHVVKSGDFAAVEHAVAKFQQMVQRIRYAQKPVVAALRGKALGGGCELSMACSSVVAALETYVGLVELAAGLMPAGTGTMQFAFKAQEKSATDNPSHIQPFLVKAFETVATAKVSTSAFEAIELGYLPENTVVVMNENVRLETAKRVALGLADSAFRPQQRRNSFWVLGKNGRATLDAAAYHLHQAGMATDYDRVLANRFAFILTGGHLTGPSLVNEAYLLKLEREVFVSLLKEKKTQERVMGILTDNKPVRN